MKGNIHKKLYCENKFERFYCCKHVRLGYLRNDKHAESKVWRRFTMNEAKRDY